MTTTPPIDYWFVFQDDNLLVLTNHDHSKLPTTDLIAPLKKFFLQHHLLGQSEQDNIFCAELATNATIPPEGQFVPLKKALTLLGEQFFHWGVKAISILNWDKNHQYCGRCGKHTSHTSSFERFCAHCKLYFYPRISPSVIVLIHRGNEIVMARSHHFMPGIYGLIAGFVEAGETLEQAAHREVQEEVGLEIKNLQYFASQPWPFPDSILVAYTAEYAGGELTINPNELEEGGWYDIDHLPGYPSTHISIGRKLIDYFVAKQKGKA